MTKYLIPVLLFGVAIALFFGFTQPLLTDLTDLQKQQASINEVLQNTGTLAKTRDALLARYTQITPENKTRLAKALPDQVDNVRLIIDIDAVATRFGLNIKNIQVQSDPAASKSTTIGPDGKKYALFNLSFDVQASYDVMRHFLLALDQSLRIIDVTGISFTADDKDQNVYTVRLQTYWLKI